MDGRERLQGAGAHPRPLQQAAPARAAGDDGLELGSGGRSSGVLGFGVVVHGSKNSWVLRAPVDAMVALAHSYAVRVGSGHGGVRSGGGELSGRRGS